MFSKAETTLLHNKEGFRGVQCSGWERRDMWVLLVGRCRKRPLPERALEIVGGELADYQHFALFLFQMGPGMQICKTTSLPSYLYVESISFQRRQLSFRGQQICED